MVLIISILVCIAVAALLVFIVRTLLKRRRAVTLVPPGLAHPATTATIPTRPGKAKTTEAALLSVAGSTP